MTTPRGIAPAVDPGAPTYRRCDDGRLHDFTGGDLMCIGIGSAPVAVQQSMWGAFKVLYRDD